MTSVTERPYQRKKPLPPASQPVPEPAAEPVLGEVVDVVIGVDTHVRTHTAAVVDARTGAVLDQTTVSADQAGYELLVAFADHVAAREEETRGHPFGRLRAWAMEGAGSHGAGLTRHLLTTLPGELVLEVDRPRRPVRRHGVKSDPVDAVRAAREALSRAALTAQATPRGQGGHQGERQALSVLLAARAGAVTARTEAQQQLFALVVAAPEPLRARFRDPETGAFKIPAMLRIAARLRVLASFDLETRTTATVLRSIARRVADLDAEVASYDKELLALVTAWRPDLLAQHGVGPVTAATILCAWSHPGRVRSDAAFAMLAGTAPIAATSGQVTTRHRLNRHGDRQLNRALHVIAITRARHHEPTRTYIARRTAEGKTPREIRRCLKRYITRELFRLLERPTPVTT